jgi:hypothetical protein
VDTGRNFAVSAVDRENQACVDKHLKELRSEWRSQAKPRTKSLIHINKYMEGQYSKMEKTSSNF